MIDYPCGTGPAVPAEMQQFFRHREASLALADLMRMFVVEETRPVLVRMLDAVVARRSPDKSAFGLGYLTGLIASYIARWIPNESSGDFGLDGSPDDYWRQIELWYVDASVPMVLFVIGSAGIDAGNKSADHAQTYAISLEHRA